MRVSLFATCLGDHFFADALADSVRVLRRLGVEVEVPLDQSCCGQPAHNSGYEPEARRMALSTLRTLASSDAVVVPSGSCAAMIRRHYPVMFADTEHHEAALELAGRTWELAEYIVDVLGVDRVGSGLSGQRIAYHHGCHALRELGVREQPLTLLRNAGAEIVDWPAAEECCGFGGAFSVKLPAVSQAMADRKLDTLSGADFLTSADPGCLLQLSGRAGFLGHSTPMWHLASVLFRGLDDER